MVSSKTKFAGVPSIGKLNLCWGGLRLCQTSFYRLHYFRTGRASHRVAVGVINMRSTAIHCEVQYNNNFDTTNAT